MGVNLEQNIIGSSKRLKCFFIDFVGVSGSRCTLREAIQIHISQIVEKVQKGGWGGGQRQNQNSLHFK